MTNSSTTHPSLAVRVAPDPATAGRAAAADAAAALGEAVQQRGAARLVLAAAPSQDSMLRALTTDPSVDWSRVEVFHMDEYQELPAEHPNAFGVWLSERLDGVRVRQFHRIRPGSDPGAETERYADLLRRAPIDLVCMGIGANGHIAFNEPDDTDFADPRLVREVVLTRASRQQQVDEGLFPGLAKVPTRAITLTVPALLSARAIVVTVLGSLKAVAVRRALTGPLGSECPATALRGRPDARLHLDEAAAALLPTTG